MQHLKRFDGFLYQWYDTTTGDVIRNPGDIDCSTEPAQWPMGGDPVSWAARAYLSLEHMSI